jgi:protoheme IX farnesyltransferase
MSHTTVESHGRGARAPFDASSLAGASEVRDWITLLKPRVLSLVVYSGVIGLLVAPGTCMPSSP